MVSKTPTRAIAPSASSNTDPLSALGSIMGLVGGAIDDIASLANNQWLDSAMAALKDRLATGFKHSDKGVMAMLSDFGGIENWYTYATQAMGTPFVQTFLRGGLGIDPNFHEGKLTFPKPGEVAHWQGEPSTLVVDSTKGVNELERMTGFILSTNIVMAVVASVLKLFLAQRHADRVDTMIGTIGEQLGLGWASGTALSQLLEVAAMRQLEELANVQLHPNRLDMMMLRQLARQHHITEDQFWAGLDLQGYPDDLKALILQMDTQQLQAADLQVLWSLGLMSVADIKEYLGHAGFSDGDIDKLVAIWITKAQTSGVAQFKATLRADYLQGKVSRGQYRDVLAQLMDNPQRPPQVNAAGQVNYDAAPDQVKLVIDMEVASADFAMEYGRVTESAAELGKLLKTGHIKHGEYLQRMKELGYDTSDARDMATIVQLPPGAGKPGLTSAKILQYAKGGMFTPQETYPKLLALGLPPKDAEFLAYNPSASGQPWYPPLNAATIKQAYFDKVLPTDDVVPQLMKLGLTEVEAKTELQLWYHQEQHQLDLSPAALKADAAWAAKMRDSLEALFMAKALGDMETINLLEETGLSQSDAGILWAGWATRRDGVPPGTPRST